MSVLLYIKKHKNVFMCFVIFILQISIQSAAAAASSHIVSVVDEPLLEFTFDEAEGISPVVDFYNDESINPEELLIITELDAELQDLIDFNQISQTMDDSAICSSIIKIYNKKINELIVKFTEEDEDVFFFFHLLDSHFKLKKLFQHIFFIDDIHKTFSLLKVPSGFHVDYLGAFSFMEEFTKISQDALAKIESENLKIEAATKRMENATEDKERVETEIKKAEKIKTSEKAKITEATNAEAREFSINPIKNINTLLRKYLKKHIERLYPTYEEIITDVKNNPGQIEILYERKDITSAIESKRITKTLFPLTLAQQAFKLLKFLTRVVYIMMFEIDLKNGAFHEGTFENNMEIFLKNLEYISEKMDSSNGNCVRIEIKNIKIGEKSDQRISIHFILQRINTETQNPIFEIKTAIPFNGTFPISIQSRSTLSSKSTTKISSQLASSRGGITFSQLAEDSSLARTISIKKALYQRFTLIETVLKNDLDALKKQCTECIARIHELEIEFKKEEMISGKKIVTGLNDDVGKASHHYTKECKKHTDTGKTKDEINAIDSVKILADMLEIAKNARDVNRKEYNIQITKKFAMDNLIKKIKELLLNNAIEFELTDAQIEVTNLIEQAKKIAGFINTKTSTAEIIQQTEIALSLAIEQGQALNALESEKTALHSAKQAEELAEEQKKIINHELDTAKMLRDRKSSDAISEKDFKAIIKALEEKQKECKEKQKEFEKAQEKAKEVLDKFLNSKKVASIALEKARTMYEQVFKIEEQTLDNPPTIAIIGSQNPNIKKPTPVMSTIPEGRTTPSALSPNSSSNFPTRTSSGPFTALEPVPQ